MRIRMLFQATGSIDGQRPPAVDSEFDVSDEIGAALCNKGQAEPVAVVAEARAETRPARRKAEKRG